MLTEARKLARSNPWAIVGLAVIAGWVLGSGALPFSLPGLGSLGGHAATAAPAPVAPTAGQGIPAPVGQLPTSSASMATPGPTDDPFAGYGF